MTMTQQTSTLTPERRVRVVLVGTARTVNGGSVLRMRLGEPDDKPGPMLMVDPAWSGVQVETVTEPWDWQAGDVVATDRMAFTRDDRGRWGGSSPLGVHHTLGDTQVDARAGVDLVVLRYQADPERVAR